MKLLLCAWSTPSGACKSSADIEACAASALNRPYPNRCLGASALLGPSDRSDLLWTHSRCLLAVFFESGWAGAAMEDQRSNPQNFGVNDKPRCPNCGARMSLTRRSPAADYALQYERQKFTCAECDHEIERVVDADGKPMQFAGTHPAHH